MQTKPQLWFKLRQNPAAIYVGLAILFYLWLNYVMPYLSLVVKAEDTQLQWISIKITLYLYFALSICTAIWSWAWFKKHWYINVVFFVICGFLLLMMYFNM